MKIIERFIDGEIYSIISVGRFSSLSTGKLSDEVKAYLKGKKLTAVWSSHREFGLWLERVEEFQKEAERLFGHRKVGVLVFVNDSEPDLPLDEVQVKKGDIIEIAYTGGEKPKEGSQNKSSQKESFFEGSDKRGYSAPYRRESEWRRPRGVK
ncbi:MAG: hypothetical protein FJY76_00415 [Candidatus Aenigmarchaeota archaeon]|nr:hypothetical protein [Candidatus Aenigmarchaeota archaeon]